MKRGLLIIGGLILTTLFTSCERIESEQVDKSGSVEMKISTRMLPDGRTVLITDNSVWVGGKIVGGSTNYDTLVSLGKKKEKYYNDNGDEKDIEIPKEYNIYITFE